MAIAIKTLERENARISKVAMEQKKKKEQDPHLITKIGQCHRCRQLVHRGSRQHDHERYTLVCVSSDCATYAYC